MRRKAPGFYVQQILLYIFIKLFLKFHVINEKNIYTGYVLTESIDIYQPFEI